MDVEAADAGFAALAEAADISIDLVGLALDAIPGVGEVALVAEVRGGRKTAAAPLTEVYSPSITPWPSSHHIPATQISPFHT